jgi:SpoIID/LytB domain protein
LRRVTIVIAVAALAASLVSLVAPNAIAAGTPLPSDATLLVQGHGWGHGRGMGQWGAYGMAKEGSTYTQILNHYYSGVTWATRPVENILVLLSQASAVTMTADDPFTVSWSDGTVVTHSDSTYPYIRARYSSSAYRVEKSANYNGPWTLVASGSRWVVFTRGSKLLQLVTGTGATRYYRGSMIARYASTGLMMAIEDVAMDEYLYGVVPREEPSTWPAEALKAQAVAARTYAAYKKDYQRSKGYAYDICATTNCQAYLGYGSKASPTSTRVDLERESTNAAVDATTRKVLTYGGKAILAEYSSSTGGYTAPGNVAYQKAVPDPGDAYSPHHDWRASINVSDFEAKWPALGHLVDVVVTKRNGYGDWGGRVLEMNLVGTSSTVTMSGYDFMHAFDSKGVEGNWFRVLIWRGVLDSSPTAVSVVAGDTASLVVKVRNTGNTGWPIGGSVRIGTTAPSPFYDSSWISSTRAASVYRNLTDPGQAVGTNDVAEFRIPISATGVAPGSYTQTFKMFADGYSAMALTFSVPIQVLTGWIEEAPNLLANASFEGGLGPWSGSGTTGSDLPVSTTFREGEDSFRFVGGGTKSIFQTVRFAGGTGRRFLLGGWSRADGSSSSGGAIQLDATLAYADGTTSVLTVPFSRASHPWGYAESTITASATKPLSYVTVRARYSSQTGTGYFDAIRLLETPVANPSFELGLAGWSRSGFAEGDGYTGGAARDGIRSLVMNAGTQALTQTAALAGRHSDHFVLSVWNKADAPSAGASIRAVVNFINTDGTRNAEVLTFPATTHDWTYAERVVSAPKDFSKATVGLAYDGTAGSAWFDGLRLARTWTVNPSFESDLANWTPTGFSSDDGVVTSYHRDGAKGLLMLGSGKLNVVQSLSVNGGAGGRFLISGWSRTSGTSSSGGAIGLLAGFRNTDGTTSWVTIEMSKTGHQFAYTEELVTAPKNYTRIDVYAVFYDQTGWGVFDGVRIARA